MSVLTRAATRSMRCRVVTLGVLAAIASFEPAAAQLKPLSVGYGIAADFLPAFVAKEEGLFEKNGLAVTLTSFPNTTVVVPAIVSGNVSIGASTLPNIVLAAQAGLDLVSISGAARLKQTDPRTRLVTRNGFSVASAKDLVGKRVGVPGINSVLDLYLRRWLLANDVKLNQLTIVEAPFAIMGDLLKSGQLDAAVAIEPLLGRILASGAGTSSIDFISLMNPDIVGALWATTRSWASQNGPTVRGFQQSLAEALDVIKAKPDRAKEIELKYLHFNGRTFPSFSLTAEPADFQEVIRIATELGLVTDTVKADALVWTQR